MKINNIKLTLFILLSVLAGTFSSCKRTEIEPRDLNTEDIIWDETDQLGRKAEAYFNNIYTYLPNGFNRVGGDFLDAASGDAIPSRNNTSIENYTNGRLSDITNPDAYWGQSYSGIRHVNIFLANIDKVPVADAIKVPWKAEVRFIRAFLYFELLKRYGGVPLIGDKVFTLNDNMELSRNTVEETVNYITSECDAIKNDLKTDPIIDNLVGRITKGAALALKCRTYLYAASPLLNGGAVTNYTGAQALKTAGITSYPVQDDTRWQKVIQAAEEFFAYSTYFVIPTSNNPAYYTIFTNKKNAEVILAKQVANNFDLEINNSPVSYINNNTAAQGRTSPTQSFVDAFPTNTGLAISETGSGYNAANPYANRDPRLAATVFYNGLTWFKRGVETFEGGLDKKNDPIAQPVQTKTGYYLRKFMGDFSNSTSFSNQSHNFILFRLAEVILNYAEALNEVNRVEDAVTQLIKIRRRAGITAGVANRYGIKAGITQSELRDLIRNERRIELAFEEHRFWDVRRWKIGSSAISGPVYGTKITKNANGTYSYEKVQVGNMVFEEKQYLLPIPYDEIVKDGNLKQNPGWSEFN